MTGFGDAEPEDAWAPDDPLPDLIANLIRRRVRDRPRTGTAQELIRADLFDEDLAFVAERIRLELEDD